MLAEKFFHLLFEVRAMRVQDIILKKGKAVHQILPSASLSDVVSRLVDFNCGSLVVTEADKVLGIITERDILKAMKSETQSFGNLKVRDFMTRKLITGCSDDDVSDLMGVMTEHRIRHVPIVDHGNLAGMISIGDLVKAQFDSLAVENHQMMSYIQGNVR
jgi:CBS domain-containing protein